jgi:hypothetical protein
MGCGWLVGWFGAPHFAVLLLIYARQKDLQTVFANFFT